MRHHPRFRVALGALALTAAPLALVVAAAGPATAATVNVTTTTDGGTGSLREAIETLAVNGGGDTVVLQAGATYQLTCTGGDLTHGSTPLIIEGNGATIEQTCAGQRVLDHGTGTLELYDVTLTGGDIDGPGAGVRTAGDLDVVRSTIRDNITGTSSAGGGIATVGGAVDVLIQESTLSGNTARNGGAVGVTAGTNVLVINSTITDNHADGGPGTGVGGALSNNGNGTFVFVYSTIVDNTAESGGGTFSIGGGSTIVVGHSVIAGGDCSLNGNTVTSLHNVTTEASCGLDDASDVLVTDVQLGALGDNGGPTLTMLPAAGSPVLDIVPADECSAEPYAVVTDQRGEARPDTAGGRCDAGAVEGAAEVVAPPTPPGPRPVVAQPDFTG